ncbi:DUF3800 domain-containing protein [Anabaena sphaerica FACHB-251]|uniref:DUF3800 domain-containing protein n=1 Tax=Anabaena sphaerica FACHB-251 TaxID=2692883 RepID=A0A926ZZR8_9NOST|nr:DUF3800 domain-containing protein [Anabaena sphaerica]MBD2292718.1 DUF3800 domain-containing protein [Anabaena sphaerica FACHB-251]
MPTIFLDECGYTGRNLLDLEQPIFSLASLNCPEETCQEIKQNFFGKVQAQELKYTQLSKRPYQQNMLLNFFHELAKNPELVKFFVAHKKYVLVTKMVEIIVEPAADEDGIDIYDKGENIGFSNLLYYTLPVIGGRDFFEDLLMRFQKMINLRTLESYNYFFELVFEKTYPDSINGLLDIFRGIHIVIGYDILDTNENLNIALSCTFSLMSDWRKKISEEITLIHDASSEMAKNRDIWDALVNPNLSPIELGYDRRKFSLPIGVKETCQKNSKDLSGLQLTDLLAGGVTQYVKWLSEGQDPENEFCKKLAETQLFDISGISLNMARTEVHTTRTRYDRR